MLSRHAFTVLMCAASAAALAVAPSRMRGTPNLREDKDLKEIFKRNQEWRDATNRESPDFFKQFASSQSPQILWIGCSDSRVPADRLMGVDTGTVFVTRNVANVVNHMDTSLMSVLKYAVEVLEVPHIVVCGHYDCGGIAASTFNRDHSAPLEQWLRSIRDVQRLYADELNAIADAEARRRRLVELNVIESCINLFKTGIVQKRRVATYCDGEDFVQPRIHPVVYDPGEGKLRALQVDFKTALEDYASIYTLYEPPDECVIEISGKAALESN